jgi:zinc transport system substrate-binding protein
MRRGTIWIWLTLLVGLGGSGTAVGADTELTVYTVNYPLAYFAERIGGELVDVHFPAPEGDPAYWSPDADAIGAYQQADLILLNGAGYAGWVKKATLAKSKLVNTSKSFRDQYIPLEDVVTHSHGPGGEHEHAGTAFTTWLDFTLATEQARAIADAFARKLPDHKATFVAQLAVLEQELAELDSVLLAFVDPATPVIGSHPVYQYLQRRYGLNMKSVHWEPDQMPDDSQWRAFEKLLEEHPARWMVWEGKADPATVERLSRLGVQSIVSDPCGNVPGRGDFILIMQHNIQELHQAYP